MSLSRDWPVRRLLGVPIDALNMEQTLALIDERIRARVPLLIGVVNAAKLVNMRRDASLRQSVMDADIILADGMSVVWACRLLGRTLPERVPGIDLMERLVGRTDRSYRVFFLGARQEILDAAVEEMRRRNPNLVIAGTHHGYFKAEDEERIAGTIRDSRADLLFVAMTSPRKEEFLARWSAVMGVPVVHGVGGAFDVVGGKVQRAPVIWQRMGLEWLYRVVQEPRRLWRRYLVTNTLFVWMVFLDLLSSLTRRPAPAPRVEP